MSDAPNTSANPFGVVVRPIQAFLRLEAASGILLLLCAVAALVWANVHPQSYAVAFDYPLTIGAGGNVISASVRQLINDGLMNRETAAFPQISPDYSPSTFTITRLRRSPSNSA